MLPNLARVIAAEAMRRPWNERPSYKVIAEVLARATGRTVTAHTINDIRHRRDAIPHQCLTMLSADDIEFARVYGMNPVAVEQLRSALLPGSIAERQFADIREKRLPAPVLMIVDDRCADKPEQADVVESPVALVAVAGGHGAARLDEGPNQMTKSSKPAHSASLADRAAVARIEKVIEPASAEPATVVQDQPCPELTNSIKRASTNGS